MPLRSWLEQAGTRLKAGPHPESARLDAEVLLRHLLGCDRAYVLTHMQDVLNAEGVVRFYALVDRRLAGEPIQYITGETEFYGLPFRVTRDVLIPRPETEHLVEKVLELAAGKAAPRIVDVGTGSGAIAVALAAKLAHASVTAIDISAAALKVAIENAARNEVGGRLRFLEGDLLGPVAGEQFDFVVSNPPYVPQCDRASLSVEVRDFEPSLALFAGEDGLTVYRRLIPAAHAVLVSGGWLALEIGYGQQDAIRTLLVGAGFIEIGFTNDLQGIPRVAYARRG